MSYHLPISLLRSFVKEIRSHFSLLIFDTMANSVSNKSLIDTQYHIY